MHRLQFLFILTLVTCAATGCGQTGPLYLPDKAEPHTAPAQAADSEPDDSEEEEEDKEGAGNAADEKNS